MDRLRVVALACLAGGAALLGYAIAQGQMGAGVFLIVPFFYGTGVAAALGMLLLMAGLMLWTLSAFRGLVDGAGTFVPPSGDARRSTRSGGVVLLGPIPLVWGSDHGVARWMMVAGLVLAAILLAIWLL